MKVLTKIIGILSCTFLCTWLTVYSFQKWGKFHSNSHWNDDSLHVTIDITWMLSNVVLFIAPWIILCGGFMYFFPNPKSK